MRRLLGTLAVLLVLAGCGDDAAPESPPGPARVVLVHATAGGGHVEDRATDVTGRADLAAYVRRFSDDLAAEVTGAAGDVTGDRVVAQVVVVGCDVPPVAHLEGDVIVPTEPASPTKECLAPVTTVAVAGTS